uniref:TTC5_OB domain-containing protein n=1 Tax=Rodentolepis nana TaxID=102285 RepID=A0A158QHL0_RODNA
LRFFRKISRCNYLSFTPAIFLPVICETAKKEETIMQSSLFQISPVLTLTGLQLDATISLVSQLILDLESQIATLTQLDLDQHHILQIIATDPGNAYLQDELTSIRNQWTACLTRCADLEYSLEIGITTLEHSLDLAVLVTPLFSKDDLSLLDRAGNNLTILQKTFENLKKEHSRLIQIWSSRVSEHIQMEELRIAVDALLLLRDTWIPETTQLTTELLMTDPVVAFPPGYDFNSLIQEVVRSTEEKPEKLSERISHIVELATKALTTSNLTPMQKAQILLLKGKALNVIATLTQDTSEVKVTLERALELDPELADACCEMGEFEWLTVGPEAALNSLKKALKIDSQNPHILWRLSMLLRQLPKDSPSLCEFLSNSEFPDLIYQGDDVDATVATSLRLAHAAVRAAKASLGRAWECLGNALFTASLGDSSGGGVISRSLAAFAQAAKYSDVVSQPHFHFNRAGALNYVDNFNDALSSWFRASLLDPAWPAPRIAAMRCLKALQKMHTAVSTPLQSLDKITRKRVATLISTLSAPKSKTRHLGPFQNLRECSFDELSEGSNKGVVCCGGVVTSLPSDSELPLNLLIVDADGTFVVLRIFQISKGSGPSTKDVITIPNPIIEECSIPSDLIKLLRTFDACVRAEGSESPDDDDISLEVDGDSSIVDIKFRIVRVPSPQFLCVNGSRVGRMWTAAAVPKNVFFASV